MDKKVVRARARAREAAVISDFEIGVSPRLPGELPQPHAQAVLAHPDAVGLLEWYESALIDGVGFDAQAILADLIEFPARRLARGQLGQDQVRDTLAARGLAPDQRLDVLGRVAGPEHTRYLVLEPRQ